METQKCCAHCPGKPVSTENDFHECCQPTYVSGNLKITSLKKHVPDICLKRRETQKDYADVLSEERSTYETFALRKRLQAENLKHQPLPDKVDDFIFKDVRASVGCGCEFPSRRYCESCGQKVKNGIKSFKKWYEPALGYKEPKTNMDLAICWETPVDSNYEPTRSTHIDGSEGGLAPAIFTLVQHSSGSRATFKSATKKNDTDSSPISGKCKSLNYSKDCLRENKKEEKEKDGAKCCCDFLCKGLSGVNISKRANNEGRPRSGYFRNCAACEARSAKKDPRLIRSAVGFALGTEKGGSNQKKTGSQVAIPIPKTACARRSFCIDTLTAPFSVVNRRRDYPEHWRLMSVYQQSYGNPYKQQYRC